MNKKDKIVKVIILVGLVSLLAIVFLQKISFVNIDLGRHLENGKIVWENPKVLTQNFYSYTEPDFAFINHHWLSGVVFYLVYLLGGFKLLTIFNTLIAIIIFLLAFNFTQKKSNFYLSAIIAIPVIFLFSERVEIRPEIFSYLFIILSLILIDRTDKDKKWRRLFWFAPLFLLWVNSHIYFFIGLALLGLKLTAEFISAFIKNTGSFKDRFKMAWLPTKPWAISFFASFLICLFNPNTWRGLLYPFNIFKNYGYQIVENKSIFFLEHLVINSNFAIFKILLAVLVLSWILYFLFSKRLRLFELFVSCLFIGLALFASRNLAIFGLISLMFIPANLSNSFKYLKNTLLAKFPVILENLKLSLVLLIGATIIGSGIYLLIDGHSYNKIIKNPSGLGLNDDKLDSINFFKENNLGGPIFNNYDIGSALIFGLFPQEKVFVDNRPEAYSNGFFTETYIPMQEDTAKWEKVNDLYKFKTIYFSYTDGTPWAQQFLGRILNDKNWSLVYFNRSTVILLNNKLNDETTIKKLKIDDISFRDRLRLLAANSTLKDRISLASLAERSGDLLLSEEIYKGILIDYPDYGYVLASLGSVCSESNDQYELDNALDYFNKALKNGYRLPTVYNQIGLIDWRLGEYQKAEDSWRSALKLEKKNSSALYYLNQIKELRSEGKLPLE
jgi:tetratricopeptide (TPR) repeat protein